MDTLMPSCRNGLYIVALYHGFLVEFPNQGFFRHSELVEGDIQLKGHEIEWQNCKTGKPHQGCKSIIAFVYVHKASAGHPSWKPNEAFRSAFPCFLFKQNYHYQ